VTHVEACDATMLRAVAVEDATDDVSVERCGHDRRSCCIADDIVSCRCRCVVVLRQCAHLAGVAAFVCRRMCHLATPAPSIHISVAVAATLSTCVAVSVAVMDVVAVATRR
jgi:hypothetical protein